jgi:hypothetical protein
VERVYIRKGQEWYVCGVVCSRRLLLAPTKHTFLSLADENDTNLSRCNSAGVRHGIRIAADHLPAEGAGTRSHWRYRATMYLLLREEEGVLDVLHISDWRKETWETYHITAIDGGT